MTDIDTAPLRELLDAATDLPWSKHMEVRPADVDLALAAVNALPGLLDEIDQLRGALDQVRIYADTCDNTDTRRYLGELLNELAENPPAPLIQQRDEARATIERVNAEALRQVGLAWDDGNAVGLDGWVGPGRGSDEVDREAQHARTRMVHRAERALDGSE